MIFLCMQKIHFKNERLKEIYLCTSYDSTRMYLNLAYVVCVIHVPIWIDKIHCILNKYFVLTTWNSLHLRVFYTYILLGCATLFKWIQIILQMIRCFHICDVSQSYFDFVFYSKYRKLVIFNIVNILPVLCFVCIPLIS